MRTDARIEALLLAIGVAWKEFPDLRLGQLIANAIEPEHLFYIEDEELMAELLRYDPAATRPGTADYSGADK